MSKRVTRIIHLYWKDTDIHEYYGSIASIYSHNNTDDIGITYGSLRNYNLQPNNSYENNKVIIRRDVLKVKSKRS